MDYRYFFMKSSDYYAELSKMSAMLANAILKNNNERKLFNVTSDGFLQAGISNYKYLIIIKEVYINLKAKVIDKKLKSLFKIMTTVNEVDNIAFPIFQKGKKKSINYI